MVKIYWWGIFIGLAILIGYLTGADFQTPANDMFSWVLIGFWISFTLTFFSKMKQAREYNSQHNSIFFISGTLFLSIFYCIWGDYTDLLTENLLSGSSLYLNTWMLLFAVPYALYGLGGLVLCYKRYFTVYLGQSPVRAQSYAFLNSLLALIWIIITLLGQYYFPSFEDNLNAWGFRENRIHSNINLLIWILVFSVAVIWIRYTFFSRRASISRVSPSSVSRQREQAAEETRAQQRAEQDRQRQREAHQRHQQDDRRRSEEHLRQQREAERRRRSEAERQRQMEMERKRQQQVIRSQRSSQPVRPSARASNFDALRPKAGVLSDEDFKCIFCFQLPKDDRDIVLCPNCKHPAHIDEFNGWMANSTLCSRCGSAISSGFRSHPPRVSTKEYIAAYRHFMKK